MKITTNPLKKTDRLAYAEFLKTFDRALLFHSHEYLDLISSELNAEAHMLTAHDPDGNIKGLLPYLVKEGPYGTVLNSSAYYGSNGGVITQDEQIADALWDSWLSLSRNGAASTYISTPFLAHSRPRVLPPGIFTTSRITHINEFPVNQLTKSEDICAALMGQYHYKTRNMVRKAEKSGVSVRRDDDDLATLHQIHVENMTAIGGKAKDFSFYESLQKHFARGDDYRIYYAELARKKIAGLLLLYKFKTVEYFTPVVQKEYRDLQPLSLLIHAAMADAAKSRYRYWNWGGTWDSQVSLKRFKERWGGTQDSYFYFTMINNPEIFAADRAALEQHYAGFFVVPYEQLQGKP